MILVNEKVEHINFGVGVVTEEKEHKIWVQFQEDIGQKIFLYPEAFEKFLKAEDQTVEDNILEELHRKQEQMELERKEREAVELAEREEKSASAKKKTTRATKKKA
jgi:hypothetical protein